MPRTIKLLYGDRASSIDVGQISQDRWIVYVRDDEVDTIVVDADRWLDGATVSSASVDGSGITLATLTPKVTLTITGAGTDQENRLTVNASDGRKRLVDFEIRDVPRTGDMIFNDYGW